MNEWKWAGRAVALGVGCVGVGAGMGVTLGEAPSPVLLGVGVTMGLLAGGLVSAKWVGWTGMWAVLLGLVTAMGVGTQWARWRFVQRVSFVEATDSWPAVGSAVHFAQPLVHVERWNGVHTFNHFDGERTVQRSVTTVPLVAAKGGPVVAFDCFSSDPKSGPGPDGAWVVLASSEPMGPAGDCEKPIAVAKQKLLAAGQVISPGAETRVVKLYKTYERFSYTNLKGVAWMSGVLLLVYSVGMVLYRGTGAYETKD